MKIVVRGRGRCPYLECLGEFIAKTSYNQLEIHCDGLLLDKAIYLSQGDNLSLEVVTRNLEVVRDCDFEGMRVTPYIDPQVEFKYNVEVICTPSCIHLNFKKDTSEVEVSISRLCDEEEEGYLLLWDEKEV